MNYRAALSNADSETRLVTPKLGKAPTGRWYATGRDVNLERSLAEDVADRLVGK